MEIGASIKALRQRHGITQETFASYIGTSVQTVSRWENGINYPDVSMLPILSSYFKVTTDYLLGIRGDAIMAKLLKTTEVFEAATNEEAEKMIEKFKAEKFPKLVSYSVNEKNGKFLLEVTKEFGVDLNEMNFDEK
ncbi:MAG: helix-turn-helix transcriptional regulator [Ruminococcaceae bacterium]|nr:helix-turn-helix transcriptional regulator [Oscillospiraceae bacterium]